MCLTPVLIKTSPLFENKLVYSIYKYKNVYILYILVNRYIWAVIVMSVWQLDLQIPMQSMPITTKQSCEFEIYVKSLSVFRQISDFLLVLRFPDRKTFLYLYIL
jgi:hypothetical protein